MTVVPAAIEQERFETWVVSEIAGGAALPGLYPPSTEAQARYEAARERSPAP